MKSPTVTRILETALYCDDIGATSDFYRRVLDREPMLVSERLVAFDAGEGTVLLIFQHGESTQSIVASGGTVPGHDGSGPTHLAFAIPRGDLAAWRARLAELGVELESEVTWPRGGVSLYFRDPDGRSVELATPGVWETY